MHAPEKNTAQMVETGESGTGPAFRSETVLPPDSVPEDKDHNEKDVSSAQYSLDEGDVLGLDVEHEIAPQANRLLSEIKELERECRWDAIVALCHPLEEKYPAIVESGLDIAIRKSLSFALVNAGRHMEAIGVLKSALRAEPEDYMVHYGIAYASYDALYRNKNRQLLLKPAEKQQLIELAHTHFKRCQQLSPGRVTPFYRDGMVFKEIEDKPRKAIPLLQKAVANWRCLSREEKKTRHQERPKYIRALYHLGSCLLKDSRPRKAHEVMAQMLNEDRDTDFVSPIFKHFGMAKVLFQLLKYEDAIKHLEVAIRASEADAKNLGGYVPDYVLELKAACLSRLKEPASALKVLKAIPEKKRRPYVRWREAEALVFMGKKEDAISVLNKALERDNRSRHKTLLRLSRIECSLGHFDAAILSAKKAAQFYRNTYGNPLKEADFLIAIAMFNKGEHERALHLMEGLKQDADKIPGFSKTYQKMRQRHNDFLLKDGVSHEA
ncbi:hypothetical protein DBT_1756 [Dissulfuribacter thermophilus]|uniref:Uncharacterized protein n=1 Tax=Dissulfuribacter thermophilus TaxID=1156395 RepID=A0A1B9F5C0_9BACT|nr:tetratricopeptide repeat protein [Dissulfuribacter thermophilus]OCC14961.1 hypothetical protein DBT_1756 [Dissulfuribacter thermophilus]